MAQVVQHASPANSGNKRAPVELQKDIQDTKTIKRLPDSYALVPPASLRSKDPPVPEAQGPVKHEIRVVDEAYENGQHWLGHVEDMMASDTLEGDDVIPWATFHASSQHPPNFLTSPNCPLPLFHEEVKSVAMINMA